MKKSQTRARALDTESEQLAILRPKQKRMIGDLGPVRGSEPSPLSESAV
jgi:hypothetical protein